MIPTYRIRYSVKFSPKMRSPADVVTIDLKAELDQVPALLPVGAYIMYIEDLDRAQNVHWTRWPKTYRPGHGG